MNFLDEEIQHLLLQLELHLYQSKVYAHQDHMKMAQSSWPHSPVDKPLVVGVAVQLELKIADSWTLEWTVVEHLHNENQQAVDIETEYADFPLQPLHWPIP